MKPRGCLPDGVDKSRIVLVKACLNLRLTQEIKLIAYFATQTSRKLVIAIPEKCDLAKSLIVYAKEQGIDFLRNKICEEGIRVNKPILLQ
jgi:hypothetical protein